MIVQHNIPAINSHRNLGVNNNAAAKNLEKLSSGYRINRAGDDAAGLAISEKMRGQIRGLAKAEDNTSQGINLIQTAEGGMQELHSIVQRMRELAVQSTNGTYHNQVDRQALDQEFQQLKGEFDRICDYTNYNNIKLLGGSLAGKTGIQGRQVYEDMWNEPIVPGTPNMVPNKVDWTDVSPSLTGATDYTELAKELESSIVPQVMNQMMETLSGVSWFAGSNIEVGLGYERVGLGNWSARMHASGGGGGISLMLNLNMDYVDRVWDADTGEFRSDALRSEFEAVIAHEMMHAVMDVTTTNGMFQDQPIQGGDGFASWFVEGMAETIGGAIGRVTNYLTGLGGVYDSNANIQTLLNELTDTTLVNDDRDYIAGYVASMYLAYQVSGGTVVNGENLAEGVSTILGELSSGKSLDDIIAKYTKYTDAADFEANFANANDSYEFTRDLIAASAGGRGSVLTSDLTASDLVSDSEATTKFLRLNSEYRWVRNDFDNGYVLGGGTTSTTGDSVHASYSTKRHAIDADSLLLQVGANGTADQQVGLTIANMHMEWLGTGTNLAGCTNIDDGYELTKTVRDANGNITNQKVITTIDFSDSSSWEDISVDDLHIGDKNASNIAIEVLYTALNDVSMARANLGAVQNRLEYTLNNLGVTKENLTAAESTIRDVDMAREMMDFTKNSILIQSAQAMLAQANTLPQGVLQLLR